ncbi:hypothetical protein [Mycolicibacterium sp.]|uniref:hypothetical protein n=1 Tax=Mycolicibacterium sp. TaxID=2320850 RepID=UPI00355E37BC
MAKTALLLQLSGAPPGNGGDGTGGDEYMRPAENGHPVMPIQSRIAMRRPNPVAPELHCVVH